MKYQNMKKKWRLSLALLLACLLDIYLHSSLPPFYIGAIFSSWYMISQSKSIMCFLFPPKKNAAENIWKRNTTSVV
ncbi:hypothetical protein QBC38DRAFT_78701 [Podospora fimiseda]|uniref:Uncharacterized protein n=1 Tax=Podospora fimiseda TaxID=252190 RepID=A0AAN7BUJ5_9PEZI|nr:hypothetical protein QBC38DRAFT_78701 [Podospora fimiseda]